MTLKAAVIGLGSRSTAYVEWCLKHASEIRIVAICDTDPVRLDEYFTHYFGNSEQPPERFADHRELLAKSDAEYVFISTPDFAHTEVALDAIRAGKQIMLEKPIASSSADSRTIYAAARDYPGKFFMGFVLRYSPIYQKIKEQIDAGAIGRLLSVEANETLGVIHGSSFFRRWHRFVSKSGGFLNTKCSHDMDILNWLIGDTPKSIASFGALTHFGSHPDAPASGKCQDCGMNQTCRFVYKRSDYPKFTCVEDICPYVSKKELVDHQTVNFFYNNGVTAVFTLCAISAEANRKTVIYGTEGTIYADLEKSTVTVKTIHPASAQTFDCKTRDGHGGGDPVLIGEFVTEGLIRNDAEEGFIATMMALAADKSMREGTIVDFDKYIESGE